MQGYAGGALFLKIRDEADDIFMKMPPPTPSSAGGSRSHSFGATPAPMSSAQFSAGFYNSSNTCFHGDCTVSVVIADESGLPKSATKSVSDLRRGDVVATGGASCATVVCVVKTLCDGGMTDLVELDGGLALTPYHPVNINGKWTFPKDVASPSLVRCDAVYSFLLDNVHTIEINGLTCICLGHGIEGDPVVSHPYFGTNQVVDDLKKFQRGWDKGLVVFNFGCMKRAERNNCDSLIVGFHEERYLEEQECI
jgi:hypothetical protein